MTATADPTLVSLPDEPAGHMPVLLGLAEMVDLFPRVARQTVYRWRTRENLPPPLLVVSATPLWDEVTILDWARERKLDVDRAALPPLATSCSRRGVVCYTV